MKYLPLIEDETIVDNSLLKEEFKAGRELGKVCLGKEHFFFRTKLTMNYISYSNIYRVFRRVQCVNVRMCCSNGELQLNNIVICSKATELAMVDLPNEESANAILKYFEENWPKVKIGTKSSKQNYNKKF